MTKTLYHYVHCPFCVRVRMSLGLFNIKYLSQVVPYADVETPQKLIGKKMLPVMDFDGKILPESLDIIKALDIKNILTIDDYQKRENKEEFEKDLKELSNLVHSLAMPYWIWTPEFDPTSRKYFIEQKEAKRGPFKDLVKNRSIFEEQLLHHLEKFEFKPYFKSSTLRIEDIMLASAIWGMYVVPEFRFPEKVHHYLQLIKLETHFNYHEDYWK